MEPALKLVGIRTARPMLGAITQLHNVFAILNTPEFENPSQIYDFGAVNTGKPGWVKLLSHGIHGLTQQMSGVSRV